jgi:hypothetical protein
MKLESITDLEKAWIFRCGQWVNVGRAEIKGSPTGLKGNGDAFDGIDLDNELLSLVVGLTDKGYLQKHCSSNRFTSFVAQGNGGISLDTGVERSPSITTSMLLVPQISDHLVGLWVPRFP